MPENNSANQMFLRVERVVRAELAFYPGRASLVARVVLACTSVMVLVMVFRMPGAALGAYYPLLLSRTSPRSTARSALLTASACTLGTIEVLVGAMLFGASPFLHFVWVAANLFLVFCLISVLKIYDTALAFGLVITNAITIWGQPLSGDTRVTHSLFTLLAILMACAISVVVEYLFAHTHRADAILTGIRQRLALVARLLDAYGANETDLGSLRTQISSFAARGTGELRERIHLARCVRAMQPQLRALLLVKVGMLHHRLLGHSYQNAEMVLRVQKRSSEILLEAGKRIEQSPITRLPSEFTADAPLVALVKMEKARAQAEGRADIVTEMRLCPSSAYWYPGTVANNLYLKRYVSKPEGDQSRKRIFDPKKPVLYRFVRVVRTYVSGYASGIRKPVGRYLRRQAGRQNSRRLLGTEDELSADGLNSAETGDRALDAQRIFELANKAYLLYVSQDSTEKAKLLRMPIFELLGRRRKCNAYIQKTLRNDLQKSSK